MIKRFCDRCGAEATVLNYRFTYLIGDVCSVADLLEQWKNFPQKIVCPTCKTILDSYLDNIFKKSDNDWEPPMAYNHYKGVNSDKYSDEVIRRTGRTYCKGFTPEQKEEWDKLFPTTLAGKGLKLAIAIKVMIRTFKKSYRQILRNME